MAGGGEGVARAWMAEKAEMIRSHALNLVLEDVLKHPWLSTTLAKSVTLAKFIRNRHQLLARFRHVQKEGKEEHRRTLRLPVPTRWYSSVEWIKSVSDNRRTISKVFRQKKFMKRFGRRPAKLNEARQIVNDKEFWGRLKVMMNLLQPIVDAIAMLEQDTCSISVVYWQFSELQRSPVYNLRLQNAPRAVQTSILKAIEARWAFLHTDMMGVSFLLDHTKTSSDFVDADLAGSVASVKALAQRLGLVKTEAEKQQLSAEVDDFQLKKSRWSSETRFKEEGLSPMAWWADKLPRKASDDNYYPLLAPLASLIYTIPTSSAASERSWSIHEFIHSKRRNRFDAKRVEKLVFIYCNAGSKDAKRNIFYRAEGESESESDGDDDAEAASDASMDEDDSSEESVCVNSESVDDFDDSNAFSYDGSEEHKEG
ncbi:hypothetical protein PR003_g28387 [Phytophthora rubi]|uniref:HAT C-terminal dimerisation domain-containing protein n=2 Tax=Phytophthora rubi TaxID=129364 RepID=A0A6A4BT53_9STRA|nr:hypothetical protein PR001_g23868 [Phytophthora rubi]KAE9278900.1 hypothetical protein PR003_g28387 [Phytophthora rubi]